MWKVQSTYCLLIGAIGGWSIISRSEDRDSGVWTRWVMSVAGSLGSKKVKKIIISKRRQKISFKKKMTWCCCVLWIWLYSLLSNTRRHYSCYTFSPLGWMHLVLNRGLRRLLLGDRSPFWATGASRVDWCGGVGFMGDLSLVVICPARHERGIL